MLYIPVMLHIPNRVQINMMPSSFLYYFECNSCQHYIHLLVAFCPRYVAVCKQNDVVLSNVDIVLIKVQLRQEKCNDACILQKNLLIIIGHEHQLIIESEYWHLTDQVHCNCTKNWRWRKWKWPGLRMTVIMSNKEDAPGRHLQTAWGQLFKTECVK